MGDSEMDWAELDEILTEMREYFEDRSDAEYFTDRASPVPNKEMQLMGRCDEGIRLLARVYASRAAPTLYEALKLAREYMHHSLGSRYEGPDPYPIIDAALAKAGVVSAQAIDGDSTDAV